MIAPIKIRDCDREQFRWLAVFALVWNRDVLDHGEACACYGCSAAEEVLQPKGRMDGPGKVTA